MFEDVDGALERILALVAKCPPTLQEKCFEILLNAYINARTKPLRSHAQTEKADVSADREPAAAPAGSVSVPEIIRGRFNTAVARLKVKAERLAGLFDFQQDPFTFHGVAVPGENKATKTRNVALLLAFKSYLATGAWTADWKEFRAMCVDQSCYDRANTGNFLSKGGYFKTASSAEGITLSSAGVSAAETLVSSMAGGTPQNDSDQ